MFGPQWVTLGVKAGPLSPCRALGKRGLGVISLASIKHVGSLFGVSGKSSIPSCTVSMKAASNLPEQNPIADLFLEKPLSIGQAVARGGLLE